MFFAFLSTKEVKQLMNSYAIYSYMNVVDIKLFSQYTRLVYEH